MNKKHFSQSVIELGALPNLIKDKKAFNDIAKSVKPEHKVYVSLYRQKLYDKMRMVLGDDAPKRNTSFKLWFLDPEKNVNEAFLNNERSNPKKWLKVVNAMYFCLIEVLIEATEDSRTFIAYYQERDELLSQYLENYINA